MSLTATEILTAMQLMAGFAKVIADLGDAVHTDDREALLALIAKHNAAQAVLKHKADEIVAQIESAD